MKSDATPFLLLALGALSGCDTNNNYVYKDDLPELRGFYVIDSDGVNSEFSANEPLVIDPYVQAGFFDVYWYASSFYDYAVHLSVNDRPGLNGAIYILSDYCGIDQHCDRDGQYICQYTLDYHLGCGLSITEVEDYSYNIGPLINSTPDQLFINLEVCDLDDTYCEIQSVPVRMY